MVFAVNLISGASLIVILFTIIMLSNRACKPNQPPLIEFLNLSLNEQWTDLTCLRQGRGQQSQQMSMNPMLNRGMQMNHILNMQQDQPMDRLSSIRQR